MNIYKDNHKPYLDKGISVIPDKFMAKTPAIKEWSKYCYQLPTKEEADSWSNNFEKSNIAICLGQASGLVALDIDEVRPDILAVIMPMLPPSPVTKVGSKGETRFFRYTGVEHTQGLKFGGEMVVELLSNNKKTTIPPSVHPSGSVYEWGDTTLLDVNIAELPMIPPSLFSAVEQKLLLKFPDLAQKGATKGNLFSGRNDALVSYCGTLIAEQLPMEEAISKLIDRDKELHTPPLFTDTNEYRHSEPVTNALNMYSNVLETVNSRRFRDSKEYEVPVANCVDVVDLELAREEKLGKSVSRESLKKPSRELPSASGVLKKLQSNILDCSWIKQPQFAFSASLITMSTLIGRKVVFQGMAPNLYVMNIAPSGSGKDAPQKKVQEWLVDIKAEYLLGAGDYVSDASLMDGLGSKPVRLDIMDECGGVLRVVNDGKNDYNSKMADVLAELYTSSNSKYLGRATAEGTKGGCYRPNVNILGSTTPTGFSEGVSLKAIEKGLLGRFLIFFGDQDKPAERLRSLPHLDSDTINRLRWWVSYKPEESEDIIGGIQQAVTELKADAAANRRLDEIFKEFDELRRSKKHTDPSLPIVARLYQQMVKMVMIHACSRSIRNIPTINVDDVEFGYQTIQYYYETIQEIIKTHIFSSQSEKNKLRVFKAVKALGVANKREIYDATRDLNRRERDSILDEMVDLGFLDRFSGKAEDGSYIISYSVKENFNESRQREHNSSDTGTLTARDDDENGAEGCEGNGHSLS